MGKAEEKEDLRFKFWCDGSNYIHETIWFIFYAACKM